MVDAITEAGRIKSSTSFVSNGACVKTGRATSTSVAKGMLRIGLDTGDTVTWRCGQDVASAINDAFWAK